MSESEATQSTDRFPESGRRITRTYGRTHEDEMAELREISYESNAHARNEMDLAVYADPAALDRLDRESVVALLERGKTWLTMAVQRDTEVGDLVEFKGQAETVRTYTVQKQLGKDAELAAAELVRRAERGIGLAIRKGQEVGEIRRHGERGPEKDHGDTSIFSKPGPTNFVPQHELSSNGTGIYRLTDGVTDDEFDAALDAAKAERNLSRANVVRKLTKKEREMPAPSLAMPQPAKYGGNRRKHLQVLQAMTTSLAGIAHAADEIAELDSSVTQEEAAQLVRDLSNQIRSLNQIKTLLKERTR